MYFSIGPAALARRMAQQVDLLKLLGVNIERLTVPGAAVVDPMCGSGVMLDVAGRLGRRIYGFDISPEMVDFARKLTGGDIRKADARKLPVADGVFDLVITSFPSHRMVEYSKEPDSLERMTLPEYMAGSRMILAECRRVLKPEGSTILVQAPGQSEIVARICRDLDLPTRFLVVQGMV